MIKTTTLTPKLVKPKSAKPKLAKPRSAKSWPATLRLGQVISLLFIMACHAGYAAEHAIILQYHQINPTLSSDTSVTPEQFQAHVDYLKANKFNVLPLEYIIERLRQKKTLPEKAVAITFDDAHHSIYKHAFPTLKQHDWPFTIFVTIKSVDANSRSFLSWEQLREMGQYGATIANHSISHDYLIRRSHQASYQDWQAKVIAEITQAESRIEAETGQSHRLFAYPYGEYSAELLTIVEKLEFTGLGQHSGPIGYNSNFLTLPRFPVSGVFAELKSFAIKLASRPMPVINKTFRDNHGNTLTTHVLPHDVVKPVLELQLSGSNTQLSQLNCFASGENAIPIFIADLHEGKIRTQSTQDIGIGRSRYNCTLPTGEAGSYYWFSQPWIRLARDSKWQAN